MFRSLFRRATQSPPPKNDRARRRSRLGLECLESREVPALFTVTTNSDEPVVNKLTLREAITKANDATKANPDVGPHSINFDLPMGQHVITIGLQLPAITCEVSIIGTITAPAIEGGNPSAS